MTIIRTRVLIAAILFTGLALALPVEVEAQSSPPMTAAEAADHDALRAALAKATEAINESRFDELKPLLYPKFTMTMINQELIGTTTELEDFLKRWFLGPDRYVRSHKMEPAVNELSQIIDGRVAIARGTNRETYEMVRGVSFTFNSRWTATLIKDAGTWKLAAIHSGVDFTDNPVLHAAAKSSTYVGLLSLVIGALGGLLAGWWLMRRTRDA